MPYNLCLHTHTHNTHANTHTHTQTLLHLCWVSECGLWILYKMFFFFFLNVLYLIFKDINIFNQTVQIYLQ